jgi:hypothetical protein
MKQQWPQDSEKNEKKCIRLYSYLQTLTNFFDIFNQANTFATHNFFSLTQYI